MASERSADAEVGEAVTAEERDLLRLTLEQAQQLEKQLAPNGGALAASVDFADGYGMLRQFFAKNLGPLLKPEPCGCEKPRTP
jgi:hypothetical protein